MTDRDTPAFTGPELCKLTARAALALLRDREIQPADLIGAAEARIAQTSPAINATVTPCAERARAAARDVDPDSPLAGLPFGVKDLTPVAGVRTTWGTKAYADHVPDTTHPLIARLEARGGVVMGKTNTPEFGAGANTFNAVFGHTRNPWDTRLNPGGSSGGAAAGLATGEVWLSHGSDTFGSLRTPAAYCGIVGLRPSVGVAGGRGFDILSVDGPMARTVADCALFLDAMAGCDPLGPLGFPAPRPSYLATCLAPPGPVRIGFAPDFGGLAPVESEMAEALAAAITTLQSTEFTIDTVAPPTQGIEETARTIRALNFWVSARQTPPEVSQHFKATLQQNNAEGAALTVDEAADALGARDRQTLALCTFLQDWDVIAAPVVGLLPLPAEVEYPPAVNGVPSRDYLSWLTFAMPASLAGLPALSLPIGFVRGLPVGVQLIGKPRGEARLLQIAHAIEGALGLATGPIDPRSPA